MADPLPSGMATLHSLFQDSSFEGTERRIRSLFPIDGDAGDRLDLAAQGDNYLICYVPRSGSTHLTSLLQHTGLMGKPADFLNPDYINLPTDEQHILAATGVHTISWAHESYGVRNVAQYLDFLGRSTRTPNRVFGMKADLYHASILIRRRMFSDTQSSNEKAALGWKYVYLTREDLLMQAVSYFRAIQTGNWTSLGAVGQPKCDFDQSGIMNCLERLAEFMRQWEIVFSLLGIRPVRLTYEELESDPRSVVGRVMRLLDIELLPGSIPLMSRYDRQRVDESSEWAARIRAAVR